MADPKVVETLAEDIAAMLHYRGRVLHPRTHPKAVGGPCEECAESGRQAAEFAGNTPTVLIRSCEPGDHDWPSIDAERLARAFNNRLVVTGRHDPVSMDDWRAIAEEASRG